jgi:hypothetical protein
MTRKFRTTLISDNAIENTTESFHLVFAIAPAIAAILTHLYGTDLHLKVELALVALVIIVNFCILGLRSKTDKTHELSLLHTFITNKLPPNRSGTKQIYDTLIAIIEDKDFTYFRGAVETKFKKTFDLEKVKELLLNQRRNRNLAKLQLDDLYTELKDWNLYFKPIEIVTTAGSEERSQQLEAKREFDDHLKGVTAVVLVQTDGLKGKPWIYNALSSWGYEHSDVPILLARSDKALFSDHTDADRFLWIPDDPKGLPWSLLHRGLSRAKAWRTQASFNRLIVWNLFYISLMFIYIGVIWLGVKNKEIEARDSSNKVVLKGMDEAISTERAFRALAKVDDSSLGVSYWYRLSGKPTVFVTTEVPHEYSQFENDNETIIGCAFVKPNVVIEGNVGVGNDNNRTVVTAYDNYDMPLPISNCRMKKLETSAIKSIICSSYDDGLHQSGATVGICVFTKEAGNYLFGEYNRKYIRSRTAQFHNDFIDLIQNSTDVSLMERQGKGLLHSH